jgi:hypothetical protein
MIDDDDDDSESVVHAHMLLLHYYFEEFFCTSVYYFIIMIITPRYRSEAEGEGLGGPLFICRWVDGSMSRSVPFYGIMIARYLDISVSPQ